MTRRLAPLATALLGALVLSTLSARADAPSGQYNPFTKTSIVIRDRKTFLVWQRYDVIPLGTIEEGELHCESLGPTLGGGTWRLPTVKELLTLVDEEPHLEAGPDGGVGQRAIDRNAFPATPVDAPYLAAGTLGSNEVWLVDFKDGKVTTGSPGTYNVRCVRAEP